MSTTIPQPFAGTEQEWMNQYGCLGAERIALLKGLQAKHGVLSLPLAKKYEETHRRAAKAQAGNSILAGIAEEYTYHRRILERLEEEKGGVKHGMMRDLPRAFVE